jgi:carbon-monoxide dehydrogenase medium subunit
MVYAGGTDLMPKLKNRSIGIPEAIMNLKGIPDLDYIRYDDRKGLTIGALATIYDVAGSPLVRENYPALAQGAHSIASIHIQNRGTIVGNICSAVPSADTAPALLALEAQVKCVSRSGERTVAMQDFFVGPGRTLLSPGEVVEEIQVPPVSPDTKTIYLKLSPRTRMDLAVVGVAVVGTVNDGNFKDIRIGLGAVAPTPMRAVQAEMVLDGKGIETESIKNAAKTAANEASPIDDHRASAEYRQMMVEVLVKRGLNSIVTQTV